ncbi:ADP-ribose pyrophosphatase [Arthrobacter mangrovi]|uniref:ADP-ribose pyrophosphatase n=2 Tax=Arthrobacter mangrovi TaxID=2966350 RepID=A0ABQ5MU45_9MICC|nr:ADP-ribose pyrophosphatase [Arthrobacter mangrovi]
MSAKGKTQTMTDQESPARDITVTAAGALCWRARRGRLEVLLIHRPRYDDWSWPKGKLDAGETNPECAVREVMEEVDVTVQLGIPLPSIEYPVASGLKKVYYWAAKLEKCTPRPDGSEVDEIRWCTPDEASRMLSNPSDREPLQALVDAHRRDELETYPFVVVRHAKARPRSSWARPEGERPLAATGQRQALAVSRLLGAWKPKRIVSSPWTRCMQTIMPYAQFTNGRIRTVDAITEHSAHRNPKKARAAIKGLLDKRKSTAVCTHRPVLPQVIKVLSAHASDELAAQLPSKDPYLKPGAVIVCQVSVHHPGRILSVEHYDAYDD